MATQSEKVSTPPLVSATSYANFINELRDHGSVPARIDKTLMSKSSGSQSSAMLATLKYLGQIDDFGKPLEAFKTFVMSTDEERKPLMAAILNSKYSFLFTDAEFEIERATSGQMAEKFRALGINGSTVTKAIAFFLAMAKDSSVKVSAHVKPPAVTKTNGVARKTAKRKDEEVLASPDSAELEEDSNVERFEIPIPGKSSVKVIVPGDLDADDWEMLQSMITVYIKRWKGFSVNEGAKQGQ